MLGLPQHKTFSLKSNRSWSVFFFFTQSNVTEPAEFQTSPADKPEGIFLVYLTLFLLEVMGITQPLWVCARALHKSVHTGLGEVGGVVRPRAFPSQSASFSRLLALASVDTTPNAQLIFLPPPIGAHISPWDSAVPVDPHHSPRRGISRLSTRR